MIVHENYYKNVVITGASGGLGQAFFSLLKECKKIFLIYNNNKPKIAHNQSNVIFLQVDFNKTEQVYNLISILQEEDIDLLVHCAGFGKFGTALSHSAEETESIFNVNAMAPILITQALLGKIIKLAKEKNKRAGLIIVSSVVSLSSVPYLSIYAAAKSAITSYGDALIEELIEEPIDVLVSCPGSMQTSFAEKAGLHKSLVRDAPEPNDIATEIFRSIGRKTFLIHCASNRKRIRDIRSLGRDSSRKYMANLVKKAIIESIRLNNNG